jgi:hypothetical protein
MATIVSPSAAASSAEPVNVVLSRDELTLVLSLLQVQTLPGLDPDPLGERNADQQDTAFVVAARGLRARGLARARAVDQPDAAPLAVHAGVLAAVGACAFSMGALFVYHWPSRAELPLRIYSHLRDGAYVIHTPYEGVLHRFTVLTSREDLVDQALTVCQLREEPAALVGELRLAGDDFAQLRQLAEQGDLIQAKALLNPALAAADLVNPLLATLANQPQVTIVQTLKSADGGAVSKRDLTLVQDASALWLVELAGDDASLLLVKPATRADVRALLLALL